MGQVWAVIKFLMELWEALKIAIGWAKKVQHEHENKEITEETEKAGDPSIPLEERLKAGQKLEDTINRNT